MKQIAGQYYFATIVTTHSVWGYVCNLKSKLKDMSMLKKCDFKVSIDKALIKRNLFIVCANIINESDIVILNGNAQILHTHSFTYLNEEGKCPGTELKIEYEEKAEKTNGDHKNIDTKILGLEYDQIQSKHQKSSNAVLDGIEIDKIQDKVGAILKDTSKTALKTGSLVAVLEQSLHANDIETINWVISNTDLHIISETIRKVNKDTLHQLMQNILIKLQQGVQKSSLLWLSTVLKIRWIDVLKFVNKKSTIHSHQSISTLLSYLNRKTKNLTKYYEVRAKLQMVIESGKAMAGDKMDVDSDLEDNINEPLENELKYQPLVYQKDQSSDDEDIDEVVEDFDQVILSHNILFNLN